MLPPHHRHNCQNRLNHPNRPQLPQPPQLTPAAPTDLYVKAPIGADGQLRQLLCRVHVPHNGPVVLGTREQQ